MQIKRSLFVFILIVSCFIPIGRAAWIWSPTESKGTGLKTQPKQEEVTAEKAEVEEELKDQITPSSPAVPVQTPTPKPQESKYTPAKSGVVGAVQKTADFLENVFRLRKKIPGQPTSGFQATGGPYSVWSPSEGKFVSPATASAIQKTAEEQYQYALKLRETGKPEEVIRELQRVVREYPQSAYAPE
ncbi:MAG: hypothetical protein HY351_04585, partial [Candidatus Omnitrophica bacterium]|nr:hypothetical protein [Candidatus Omnitrophota bacterium]